MSTRSDCASPSPSMTMHLVSSSHRTILPTAIFPRCACPRRGTGRSEPGHDQHLCQTLCDCNANCTAYEWGNDCYLSTGVVQPACLATDSRVNPTPHTHPTPPQLTRARAPLILYCPYLYSNTPLPGCQTACNRATCYIKATQRLQHHQLQQSADKDPRLASATLGAVLLARAKPLHEALELASLPFGRLSRRCVRRRLGAGPPLPPAPCPPPMGEDEGSGLVAGSVVTAVAFTCVVACFCHWHRRQALRIRASVGVGGR